MFTENAVGGLTISARSSRFLIVPVHQGVMRAQYLLSCTYPSISFDKAA
jgi:hypothetical protein